jgi:hypothetical protein
VPSCSGPVQGCSSCGRRVNDGAAPPAADVGIATGGPDPDLALPSADAVGVRDNPGTLAALIRLSRCGGRWCLPADSVLTVQNGQRLLRRAEWTVAG